MATTQDMHDLVRRLNAIGLSVTVGQARPVLDAAFRTEGQAISLAASNNGWFTDTSGNTTRQKFLARIQVAKGEMIGMDDSAPYDRGKLISLAEGALADLISATDAVQADADISYWDDALYYLEHPVEGVKATLTAGVGAVEDAAKAGVGALWAILRPIALPAAVGLVLLIGILIVARRAA